MSKVYMVVNKENNSTESVWTSKQKANLHASGLNYKSINNGGDPLLWNVQQVAISK